MPTQREHSPVLCASSGSASRSAGMTTFVATQWYSGVARKSVTKKWYASTAVPAAAACRGLRQGDNAVASIPERARACSLHLTWLIAQVHTSRSSGDAQAR
jgi:hypothetical protein